MNIITSHANCRQRTNDTDHIVPGQSSAILRTNEEEQHSTKDERHIEQDTRLHITVFELVVVIPYNPQKEYSL